MWITFYFCGKVWYNVDNFVDKMWITSLFLNLFEIKQNELCTHVCIIYPGLTSTTLFLSVKPDFLIKNNLHFWTMCKIQKPLITRGYFTYPKNPPWLPEGECVPLSPITQFSTSRSPPKFPPKIPNFRSRTTSTHLRKVLYFQQLSAP